MSEPNDYLTLENKPSVNGVELQPGLSLEDIGVTEMTPEMVTELYLEIFGFVF
jgi:hypothetical protein